MLFSPALAIYGDKLTAFSSESITYDEYGRTTYYRGKAITYYEYDFNRIQSIGGTSFTYDADGMRRTKTVGGVTHTYYYDGIKLISEEWGNNTIVFLYDASGSPIGMQYRRSSKPAGDWDTYYYEKNLQGDIVAVYGATGTKLVTVGIIYVNEFERSYYEKTFQTILRIPFDYLSYVDLRLCLS